jgi:hypothetical protein
MSMENLEQLSNYQKDSAPRSKLILLYVQNLVYNYPFNTKLKK